MRRSYSVVVVGLILVSSAQAGAAGKTKSELLGKLAEGTLSGVLGNTAFGFLTNLGVFDVLGIGGGPDPVINAKLDEIINQLKVIQADITELQNDVTTLTNTVGHDTDLIQLNSLLADMEDASGAIQRCAQQVTLIAQAPGSDATDQQMNDFALQMVGRQAGPCDLSAQFSIIHARIVTDQVLGDAQSAFYVLLARVARDNGIEFERIASHFIQYQITQREALELIRGAYSSLGEASNLQTVFTQAPTDFLGALKDEEIAFLQAADAYITAGPPPYDPSPAALADAVVQRLEGVSTTATTFSLSILDNAIALTPTLQKADGSMTVPYPDSLTGAVSSYYAMANTTLTAGIRATCLTSPSNTEGFSYTRPDNGVNGGFKIGSSCTLHLERHLANNVPAGVDATWKVAARHGLAIIGAPILRNAASLSDETAAEYLALAGDPAGRASGYSKLTVIADATNPSIVSLAVDLPNAPATPIAIGVAHPFVAGGSATAQFIRVPYGADFPDRYALQRGAKYLTIDATGFAAEADTPTYFDFQKTSDGYVELEYAGGIVFVDVQYTQWFYGESPDDVWAGAVNIASGTTALAKWGTKDTPNLPLSGHTWGDPLIIYPPCRNGVPHWPSYPYFAESTCSDDGDESSGWGYIIYAMVLFNEDSVDRAFQITIGATASLPSGTTSAQAGLHCYNPFGGSPDDHWDVGAATVASSSPTQAIAATFDVTNRGTVVPKYDTVNNRPGAIEFFCQILDGIGEPAQLNIDNVVILPCKNTTGPCEAY